MSKAIVSTVEELLFPDIAIRLRAERVAVDHYDPSADEERRRRWVEVTTADGVRAIPTVAEFCALLRALDGALLNDARAQTAALIVRDLIGEGMVVIPHPGFDYLEQAFSVQLAAQRPRFEQGHLRFLTMRMPLSTGVISLRSIDIDLGSGQVLADDIPGK
ncbi:hypothetical protein [Massilia sp. PWRC2]|uniref:hypothetical protein n=1 Tax=Massilia sp. PWRC2 TaxID=2804626 RepID=UPI003CF95773